MITPKTYTQNYWKAVSILITGILITIAATVYVKNETEKNKESAYVGICNEIKTDISFRLQSLTQLLYTSAGLFEASDTVNRQTWKAFNEQIIFDNNLRGIQGVGYAQIIPKNQLQQHIRKVQNEGFPDYTVKPAGDRKEYTSIVYIEPFINRNLLAFGYDMFTDSIRRKAMEFARDFDTAAITGKVILKQETGHDLQAGTLMYVPVYNRSTSKNTIEQRRAAIKGWVFSAYRMHDLMDGIFGTGHSNLLNDIHLEVYNDSISTNSILFNSLAKDSVGYINKTSRTVVLPIDFNGTKWLLKCTQINSDVIIFTDKVLYVFFIGLIVSCLLFGLAMSQIKRLQKSEQIANLSTADLNLVNKELLFQNDKTKLLQQQESLLKLRYQSILNTSTDGIYVLNLHGNIVEANPAFCSMLGYTMEEILKLNIADLDAQSNKPALILKIAELVNQPAIFETKYRSKDGTFVNVETNAVGIMLDGENYLYASSRNITQRKLAEAALQQSKNYLDDIINNIGDPVFVKDEQSRMIKANDALCKLFGLKRSDIIGKTLAEDVPPNERESFLSIDRQVLADGLEIINEETFTLRGGITQIISTRKTRFIDNNGQKFLVGVIHDITKRVQAEQAVQQSKDYLDKIINNISSPIFVKDENHKVCLVNDVFCAMLGTNKESIIGTTGFEHFTNEQAREFIANDDEVFITGKENVKEETYTNEQGVVSTFITRKTIFTSITGEKFLIVVLNNITERKQKENELSIANDFNQTLLSNLPFPMDIVDEEGNILFVAPEMEKIFSKKALGKKCWEVCKEDKQQCNDCPLLKEFEVGKTTAIESNGIKIANGRTFEISHTGIIYNGKKAMLKTFHDITNRKLVADIQQFLLELGSSNNGLNYFQSLAKFMAEKMRVQYICIDKLEGDNLVAETLAIYNEGEIETNVRYALKDTPCGQVLNKGYCYFEKGVSKLFPADDALQDLKAESYIGSTLFDSKGKPIGLIAIIGQQEMDNIEAVKLMMQLICPSASAELERRQGEEKIRQRDELITKLTNQVPGVVYQYRLNADGSSCFPFASEGMFDIYEVTPAEVQYDATPVFERLHPDDYDDIVATIQESARTLEWYQSEFRVILPNQGVRWRTCSAKPEKLLDGSILWHGIILDITDRKKLENTLIESEYFFKESQKAANIGSFKVDMLSGLWESSEVLDHIFGISKSFVKNTKGWLGLVHPDDELMVDEYLAEEVVKFKKNLDLSCRINRKTDGQTRWINVIANCEFSQDGQLISMIGTVQDITESKLLNKALLESGQRYQVLFDKAMSGIWVLDLQGNIIQVNQAFATMHGYTIDEIKALGFKKIDPFISDEQFEHSMEMMLTNGSLNMEVKHLHKNGNIIYLNLLANIIEIGGKKYTLAFHSDITARKLAEENLKKLTEELKNSNADLENFAYIASHDLQEPLRMVTGFLSLLKRGLGEQLDDKNKQFISYAEDGADRMRTLIKDLLQFSRTGNNKETESMVDLNETLSYIRQVLSNTITKNEAVITILPLPTIMANHTLINELFMNLINNALKYRGLKAPEVEVGYSEQNEVFTFYVKDNGIGISAEHFENIFVIFKRLHSKDEYSGTGIGLALCKKIVEKHHGKIWVESEEGKGSIFYFTVPK